MKAFVFSLSLVILLFTKPLHVVSGDVEYDFYYHSNTQQAIILESLNGDNRSVVEQTGQEYIYGPGPSPNNNWFAYATGERNLTSLRTFSLIDDRRLDIGEKLDLSEGFFSHISWANDEDLIVFAFSRKPELYSDIYIFDPNEERFIQITSQDSDNGYDNLFHIDWLTNDQGIIIYNGSSIEIFNLAGDRIESLEANLESSRFPLCRQARVNTLLNHNRVVYLSPESQNLIIHDLSESKRDVIVDLPRNELVAVFWSEDNRYALLFFRLDRTTLMSEYAVWLYSAEESLLTEIQSSARMPVYCNSRFYASNWNGHLTTLSATDSELIVINAESNEMDTINPNKQGQLHSLAPVIWQPASQKLGFAWSDLQNGDVIYTYDTLTHAYTREAPDNQSSSITTSFFAFSPSDSIAYTLNGRLQVDFIGSDKTIKMEIKYPQDSIYGVQEILWHPVEDWLIATSSMAGTNVTRRLTLVDITNAIPRFLTDCAINEIACFGWLYNER